MAHGLRPAVVMIHSNRSENRLRRPRRYALGDGRHDLALFLILVAVFVVMALVALAALGRVPLPLA